MRKLLSTLVLTTGMALLGSLSPAFAHCGSCGGDHAEKAASTDKAACAGKDKAACGDKAACEGKEKTTAAAACCPGHDTAAKGGAADDKSVNGYRLGQVVPAFSITDTKGNNHDLSAVRGEKPVMLVFYNQSCPYVVEMENRFDAFAKEYKEKVHILAIDAGTNNAAEAVTTHAKEKAYPVALNAKQDLAIKFDAKKTPEVFLLNKDGKIVYHGAFDNGEQGAEGKRETYAKDAVDAILAGNEPAVKEKEAFGCRIRITEANLDKTVGVEKEQKQEAAVEG